MTGRFRVGAVPTRWALPERASARGEEASSLGFSVPAAWLALHAVLGVVMTGNPTVATTHALIAAGAGLIAAATGRPAHAAYAIAYMVGADVLWRMTGADVWWEMGKYSVAGICLVGLLRQPRVRWQPLALIYFGLLLPSIVVAPYDLFSFRGRSSLSFNLSGPFSLMVSVLFLSHVRLSGQEWLRVLVALVGPLMAIAAIGVHSTVTATELVFTGESNKITSGGFGPNQVSTVLGLGALLPFMTAIGFRLRGSLKLLLIVVSLVCVAQGAMTFSRGGLYGAVGALALGSLFFLRRRRERIALIAGTAIVVILLGQVVFPRLDQFTGGALATRFESTDPTGRTGLMAEDLDLWSRYPLVGVGPGGAHAQRLNGQPAHTEFSRMLAEHGTFGLLALVALLALGAQAIRAAPTPAAKGFVVALFAWSFLTMMHSAMRTAAAGVAVGLAFTFVDGRPAGRAVPETRRSVRRKP